MGLNLYRYRIEKPNLDADKVYSAKELDRLNLEYRTLEDNEDFSALPQSMIDNFCQKILVKIEYFDYQKIFGFFLDQHPEIYRNVNPDDVSFSIHVMTPDSYTFIDHGRRIPNLRPKVKITAEESDDYKAITKLVTKEAYVYRATQEAYQRKGITSEGWDYLPENSVYCFDADVVKRLTEHGLSTNFLDNWEDGVTAFYPNW